MRRPISPPMKGFRSLPSSMRGMATSTCRCSRPAAAPSPTPRLAPLARSGASGRRSAGLHRRLGGALAVADALPQADVATRCRRRARRARYRLGRPDGRRAYRKVSRRLSRNICALLTRSRKTPLSFRADDELCHAVACPTRARDLGGAGARCCRDRGRACGLVPARLGRRRVSPAPRRPQCRRPPGGRRPEADRIHPVAPGCRRGGNPIGCRRAELARTRLAPVRSSICTCAAWPGLAPGPCFSRLGSTMRRPAGCTGRPDSTKSAAGRAIMTAVRRPWCCAATLADAGAQRRYDLLERDSFSCH